MSSRTVQIGQEQVTLHAFNALKYLEATDLIAGALEKAPALQEEADRYVQEYREKHAVALSRATAELQYGDRARAIEPGEPETRAVPDVAGGEPITVTVPRRGITERAWETSDHKLEVKETPDQWQLGIRLVPKAYRAARWHLEMLLALVCTPNEAMERDEQAGRFDFYVEGASVFEMRQRILHKATLRQLIAVANAAVELVREELDDEAVRELGKAVGWLRGTPAKPEEPKPNRSARRAKPIAAPA